MKKLIIALFLSIQLALIANAQVPLQSIVEHFTNTKCSICTSRNPGFYTNLNSTASVLHLSIHPSAPYATCALSQQNTADNDARTNYYGVYGSTPRLVINGDVISNSANYSSPTIFGPYLGLTSSFSLTSSQVLIGTDSIRSTIVIKKVATSTTTTASLFIGLAEDTIFFNGGNGESAHYNVLRKAPSTSLGITVTLPSAINDSIIISRTSYINPIWNQARMFTMAILQDASNKDVIQSGKSGVLSSGSTGINDLPANIALDIYPNPSTDFINISINEKAPVDYEIFDMTGKMIKEGRTENNFPINTSSLENGIYAIRILNSGKYFRGVFCIHK